MKLLVMCQVRKENKKYCLRVSFYFLKNKLCVSEMVVKSLLVVEMFKFGKVIYDRFIEIIQLYIFDVN